MDIVGVDVWPELVELYEYKVADALAQREPRGGRRSLVALRDALLFGTLDPALTRRFRAADKLWREHAVTATPPPLPESAPESETPEGWNVPSAAPLDREGEILAQLALAAWRAKLEDELEKLASAWRRERGLVTLRALYALSLNLEAGRLAHGVPREGDPLVSLGNPAIALGVLSGLADQLLAYRSQTRTALAWARSVLLELAQRPFLDAREEGADVARVSAERTQIREALARGIEALSRLLPQDRGGTGDDPPKVTRALFAREEARRLEAPNDSTPADSSPDDTAGLLALRLAGEGEVRWQGHTVGWGLRHGRWQLHAGGAAYSLGPQRPQHGEGGAGLVRASLGERELRAFWLGEYLLLQLEVSPHAGLPATLALGRGIAALLEPGQDFLNLRLARGVAQRLRDGRFDAASLGPESAARYATSAPDALFAFARRGAENLLTRLERGDDLARAFGEVARGLNCPEARALRLLGVLRLAQTDHDFEAVREVRRAGEAAFVAYQGEPLTVAVAGRVLTLRADYQGEVTAVLPGAPASPVRDLWVFTVPQGGIVVARQGLQLAVSFQPSVSSGQ